MPALVIIPTFNEKENVEAIIRAVFEKATPFHLLIVDDASPDGTAQIVKALQQEFPKTLHLLERKVKDGIGKAYIAGFKWGLSHQYDQLIEMDADFSHNPDDLIRLLQPCQQGSADVTVGSRYVSGGKVVNWPWERHFYSRGGSIYTRLVTLMPIKDPTAGFVCWNKSVLEIINLDKIKFVGYAFQIEMKFAAWKRGFKIMEVPITFKDRVLGTSKMSLKIVQEGILGVLQMRWRGFFGYYHN